MQLSPNPPVDKTEAPLIQFAEERAVNAVCKERSFDDGDDDDDDAHSLKGQR